MPTSPTPADRPAEGLLGPITPIRCNVIGCHWACHGVPDKYADSRARIIREHMAAEHAPAPEPADGPADQLRDCIAEAAARLGHPQWDAADLADAVLSVLPAPALAVARQLLGTSAAEGGPCPTPETHNWGCGCPTDEAPTAKRVEAEHVLYDALTKGTPLAQVRQHIIDEYRAAVIAEHTHAAPPAPADRAAVLREDPTPVSLATTLSELADEQTQLAVADDLGRRRDMAAARRRFVTDLRALADDAAAGVQPPTTTADRAAALGMTPTEYRQHSHTTAVEQIQAAAQGLFAGTAIRVMDALATPPAAPAAPEDPTPAPQCSAGLLPATDEAVDRCVRHGAHDTHATAAGVRWPNEDDPEL